MVAGLPLLLLLLSCLLLIVVIKLLIKLSGLLIELSGLLLMLMRRMRRMRQNTLSLSVIHNEGPRQSNRIGTEIKVEIE